jgi:AbrB family looped-hinge helix DNA binding protein
MQIADSRLPIIDNQIAAFRFQIPRFPLSRSSAARPVILQCCYTALVTKVITVNERGALTLPREVRDKLGVTRGGHLVVDMNDDGEVLLRAGVVVPVEVYSAARVEEFQRMNEAPLTGRKLSWRKKR